MSRNRGLVPQEMPLTIYVNGRELATLMCSPTGLEYLAAGFLYHIDVVVDRSDIRHLHISAADGVADVEVKPSDRLEAAFRRRRQLTSGCGGGLALEELAPLAPLTTGTIITPEGVAEAVRQLVDRALLYPQAGGVHTSALFKDARLSVMAEDIGRHNTVDKIAGECLLAGIDAKGGWLVTTGRLSSDMISKAGHLGTPIVISRTSPTSLAVEIAAKAGIAVIGYAHRSAFTVYSNNWRVDFDAGSNATASPTRQAEAQHGG